MRVREVCSKPIRGRGNIRQLKNVAEQISAVEESRSITADILRKYLPDYAPASVPVVRGQAQGRTQ